MTRRNLELVEPLRAGARGCTLLETLDATVTPMGGRLLRQWLLSPLRDPAAIGYRLDAVEVAVATAADARGCARRWTASATWSGWPAARPRAERRRASWARSATRSSGCRTWRRR